MIEAFIPKGTPQSEIARLQRLYAAVAVQLNPCATARLHELLAELLALKGRLCTMRTNGQRLFELCVLEGVPMSPMAWVNLHPDWQAMWERIAEQFGDALKRQENLKGGGA